MTASVLLYWHLEKNWSIQSINTITEPKKEYGELYHEGDAVQARFAGTVYPAVIVKISSNRVELMGYGVKIEKITSSHEGVLGSEDLLLKLRELDEGNVSNRKTGNAGEQVKENVMEVPKKNAVVEKNVKGLAKGKVENVVKNKAVPKTGSVNGQTKGTGQKKDDAKRKIEAASLMAEEIIAKRQNIDTDNRDTQSLEDEISNLRRDLESMKEANNALREENKRVKSCTPLSPNMATPTKVKFLKDLASFFEDQCTTSCPPQEQLIQRPPKRSIMPDFSAEPSTSAAEVFSPPDNKTSPYSVTKKIMLLPNFQIFVTPRQLSYIKQHSNSPRALMIVLLDTLFDRETLAKSSAKGARQAVNKTSHEDSAALDGDIVAVIKEYTLRQYKGEDGRPCISDAAMNDLINSKCASARRALKKIK